MISVDWESPQLIYIQYTLESLGEEGKALLFIVLTELQKDSLS